MERKLSDLSNSEIMSALAGIKEELLRRKGTMEKKKMIPFPSIGKEEKKEEIVTKEETIEESMEKEISKRQEETLQTVCRHQISTALLAKTQFGVMMCGNCRKAMFITNIGWMELDSEFPEEWLR